MSQKEDQYHRDTKSSEPIKIQLTFMLSHFESCIGKLLLHEAVSLRDGTEPADFKQKPRSTNGTRLTERHASLILVVHVMAN